MKTSRVLTALVSMTILIATIGCSKDKDNPTGPDVVSSIPAGLVATWNYQSVTINGIPNSLPDVLDFDPGTIAARLTINSNGSFVYEETDSSGVVAWMERGTIAVSGNEFTSTTTSDSDGPVNPPFVEQGTYVLSLNRLEIETVPFASDVYEFVLTR